MSPMYLRSRTKAQLVTLLANFIGGTNEEAIKEIKDELARRGPTT